MSSLIKRNGIYYYQWYEHGKCHKRSLFSDDKNVAKQRASVIEVKRLQGSFGLTSGRITVNDCLNKFLDQKQATLKDSTFTRYVGLARGLFSFFGRLTVKKLTTDLITEYIESRKKEVSGKTIHEEINILKGALNSAWSDRIINEIPIRIWPTVKKTPVKPETLGYYSINDIAKLKEYFKGKKFEPVFMFALYTGCRRSEVAAVTVSDIDFSSMTIKIRNIKTESDAHNAFRYISINNQLYPVLIKQIEEVKTGVLFPWFAKITDSQASKIMKKACNETGVAYKRFHGLRHTMATFLIAQGVNVRDVMSIMGWTELATAERYTHLANALKNQMNIVPF